jgi:subtilase family serine protease
MNLRRWFAKSLSSSAPRRVRTRCLHLEELEPRLVPSANLSVPIATPGVQMLASSAATPSGQPAGFSPQQISQAYGFNQISFNGIQGNGNGQTIAIVDAYNDPNIASDLAAFDSTYGIAAPPSFSVVNQNGGSNLPTSNTSWAVEESLDVEWAHAMAPGANIVLVEANSSSLSNLLTAVQYAANRPGVSVVSTSWGSSEWSGETAYNSYFSTPSGHQGVTFVASSGDSGSSGAPIFPSVSPNVIAVGGTQLTLNSSGGYGSETAWSGSGGGISAYESQPSYQQGVVTQSNTMRTVPDVAYNASGNSPYAVYDSYGYGGWLEVYGTSAGAPQWSALVAIADQGRALDGEGTLNGATQTLPALYQLPSSDYHEITSGSNGAYSAGPGYNLVTGLGSPVANLVVSGLVSYGNQSPPPSGQGPSITTPASATPNPVTGTTTNLSVSASDPSGASGLTYTWSVLSEPSGASMPTFSVNASNAASTTTATFYAAGTYTFAATVMDPSGLTATSDVTVTVNQTLSHLLVSPNPAIVQDGTTQQFTATAEDQFGHVMTTPPTFTWTLISGSGTLTASGLYTAPTTGTGSATVQASSGGFSATASLTYGSAPLAPSNLTATAVSSHQVNLSWTNNANNATGFIIQRSTNDSTWTTIASVGGNTTSYSDTSLRGGTTYYYRVLADNSFGDSSFSNTAEATTSGSSGGGYGGWWWYIEWWIGGGSLFGSVSYQGQVQQSNPFGYRQTAADLLFSDTQFLNSLSSPAMGLGAHGRSFFGDV